MIEQLLLPMKLRDDATFANFYEGSNQSLVASLKALIHKQSESYLYLWGQHAVGKTHLLQACCHAAGHQQLSCIYLDLADPKLSPAILDNIEQLSIVCIDNVEHIFTQSDWEEALCHCYNRLLSHRQRLVIAGTTAPMQSHCQLADLKSRLAWGLSYALEPLSDQDKLKALELRAKQRGLVLSPRVAEYLMRHYQRDMTYLFEALELLDKASLAAQRRLTIPFVKSVLLTATDH